MIVDDLEGGEQPLARLAVEILDALAQPLDRLDEIIPLGGKRAMLRLDLAQLLLGAQIDGAEALALAAQAIEPRLDLAGVGKLGATLELGELRNTLGRHFQHFADFMGDIVEPALGALEPLLGAG